MNLLTIIVLFFGTTSMLYSMDDNNTPAPDSEQGDPITHLWKQPNTPEQEAAKDALGYRRYTKSKHSFDSNQNVTRAKLYDETSQMPQQPELADKQVNGERSKLSELLASYFSLKH